MWIILQAFVRLWTWISTRLFSKKCAQSTDVEKMAGSGEDPGTQQAARARNRYGDRRIGAFQTNSQNYCQREPMMLQRNTFHASHVYYGLRRGTVGLVENNPYYAAPFPILKHGKQPRKDTAKYRLRQDVHVDNWDCELSEMYGKKSPPQPSTPSPFLSGFSPLGNGIGEEMYRFPDRSPNLSCTSPRGSIFRSPFLDSSEPPSSKQSPLLAQIADLTQAIMTDFKPVIYSTNALSAVSDTFWDAPAFTLAKPPRAFGASNRVDANNMLAESSSVAFIWSLPSFPNSDLIDEARDGDLCRNVECK